MINGKLKFCPSCGKAALSYVQEKKWICGECGFDLYNNVAAAVGVIISDSRGNVLFEVRAKDPGKGCLALPGGFVDRYETAENAATRECKEETGFLPKKLKYLCSFPNDYEYKKIAYKTCDIFFTAELPEQYNSIDSLIDSLQKQKTEVTAFKSCRIRTLTDIERLPIAFDSAKKTLTIWLSENRI